MFSARKRIPLSELQPQRIGLIKPSAFGDIIHSLPVLSALRQRFPEARIVWVVNREYESLLRDHPDLDDTLPFDRSAIRVGWRTAWDRYSQFWSNLRAENFDLVIDLQGLFRSGLMSLLTGAPRRIGLSTARECAGWFYTDIVGGPDMRSQHAVERNWTVAQSLHADLEPIRFEVSRSDTEHLRMEQRLSRLPRPWVVFGVGARWESKRWLEEHFLNLGQRILDTFGGSILFIGQNEETPIVRNIQRHLLGSSCDLTAQTGLPELTAVLSLADLMVANDTGPVHLAAALGTPVVAPYTCTKAQFHGPYKARGVAVESTVSCQGSYLRRCSRLQCMQELTPDRLWPHVRKVLSACRQQKVAA